MRLECHVVHSIQNDIPPAITLFEIQKATLEDPILSKLLVGLQTGNLSKKDSDFKDYANYFDELSIARDIVLRGERIVIPSSLIHKVVSFGHEGHQGIIKSKKLLRSKFWFPRMDHYIEKHIQKCISCQATVNTPAEEPVQNTVLPDYPWQAVDLDFLGPFPEVGPKVLNL